METITNAASAVTSTVSGLIYGQPAKEGETTTANNETGGKEPLSGEQGKGTVNEPFDQGNSENPVSTSSTTNTAVPASGNTSYKDDDFLKLNPTMGQPTTTESSTDTKNGATGTSEKVWKPTELDEVKQSGAPGAGPEAPDYKPATPDLSSTTSNNTTKQHERVGAGINTTSDEAAKKDTPATEKKDGVEYAHSDTAQAQPSVGGPIEEILNKGTSSKDEHTIPESEANDPHSKMNDKTVRATEAHKTDVGDVESHPAEKSTSRASESSRPSESSKPVEPASPNAGDDKSDSKMSGLKDKLKNKLHIGHKDK